MDTRGMSSRSGGAFRTLFVVILTASVMVLGYRYSKLRTKYEEKNMILIERDYEVKEKQEEASGIQRQLIDSNDAKQQCDATLEKERKDHKAAVTVLEDQVHNKDNKIKELEGQKNNLQAQVDACKNKDAEINNIRKEKDTAVNEAGDLRKGKDDLQRLLDETRKQLEDARNKSEQIQAAAQKAQNDAAAAAKNLQRELDAKNILIGNLKLAQDVIEQKQKTSSSNDINNRKEEKLIVVNSDQINENKITNDEEQNGETGEGSKISEKDETGVVTVRGEEKVKSNDDAKEMIKDAGVSNQNDNISETDGRGEDGDVVEVAGADKEGETDETTEDEHDNKV